MSEPVANPSLTTAALLAALRANLSPLLRAAARWFTWVYLGGLSISLCWLEWAGERFWLSGVFLFAPPQVLLLPLLFLTPFCLLVRARLLAFHVLALVLVVFGYMGWRWNFPPAPVDDGIRLVTHNAGQSNRPQFYQFVAAEKPDIVALQDARGAGPELSRKFPGYHIVGRGEFYLVSRFPIVQSDPVADVKWFNRPAAARFELLCHDRTLILYSVHLPTPRQQLNRFLSGRAFADMMGDEDSARRPLTYGEWTRARLKLAADLAAVFERETKPFIVCGDFNTPDHGIIYHTVSRHLTDSHRVSGRGFGFTFPGSTRNPLTLRGPWLRIDYAFAGRGWKPIFSAPEPGRLSQHCALAAHFVPVP
jgi:endonuclease/exonuclease/phosphatase (EEP) superfamily protein YafD